MTSLVQSSGKQFVSASGSNPTYTLTGVTSGNTLIALVTYYDASSNSTYPSSLSDSVGGTLTSDLQLATNNHPSSHASAGIYSLWNVAAGSHTITITRGSGATSVYYVYEILEVSGLPATNSLSVTSTGYGNSTGPVIAANTATLSQAGGFAVTLCEVSNVGDAPVIYPPEIGAGGSGSNYTGLFQTSGSDLPSGSAGYTVPGTTAALGTDFGGISTGSTWAGLLAYYLPASSGTNTTLTPSTGALSATGYLPSQLLTLAPPATGALALQGFAPSLVISTQTVVTLNGVMVITGFAPGVVVATAAIVPAKASLTLTGYAPTVSIQNVSFALTPFRGALAFKGFSPTIINTGNVGAGSRSRKSVYVEFNGERYWTASQQDAQALLAKLKGEQEIKEAEAERLASTPKMSYAPTFWGLMRK